MMKLTLMRTEKEDTGLPAPQIAAQINASQCSSNRHIPPSTVQRRLRESGLHGQIAARKPLQKGINKKKRLAWAKKHEQWKSVLWSYDKFEIFVSNLCVFVRRRVGERMISARVVPVVKHGGGGVVVWGCFAGDNVMIYLEFKAHSTSMATTAFSSSMPPCDGVGAI
jgi:hypothetical protein